MQFLKRVFVESAQSKPYLLIAIPVLLVPIATQQIGFGLFVGFATGGMLVAILRFTFAHSQASTLQHTADCTAFACYAAWLLFLGVHIVLETFGVESSIWWSMRAAIASIVFVAWPVLWIRDPIARTLFKMYSARVVVWSMFSAALSVGHVLLLESSGANMMLAGALIAQAAVVGFCLGIVIFYTPLLLTPDKSLRGVGPTSEADYSSLRDNDQGTS